MGAEGMNPFDYFWLRYYEKWLGGISGFFIALSKQGYYEWEDFRQTLIATIAEWESTHDLNDPEWDYYQCWVSTLEKMVIASGVVEADELKTQLTRLLECKAVSRFND